jgi:glycosyltransferase involved in cell wall biosynthesis
VTAGTEPCGRTAVISANSAWNIVNFRKPIVEGLRDTGWRVIALAQADGHEGDLAELGVEFVRLDIDSGGMSVWKDARLALAYRSVLRRLRPQVFLGFTVKPNIYGSLAAWPLGIRVVNNISGLGTAFLRGGLLGGLVSGLYRLALRSSATVFFQNRDDRDLFVGKGLVRAVRARLIAGSGVDLERFAPTSAQKPPNTPFRFLFVGRLLADKGLFELAEAARMLRPSWPDVEFVLLGSAASSNPSAVPISEVERWRLATLMTWLGETKDVRPFLETADCVVLPSYREGVPRSLLEAAAMGKPMVATDVPGCREIVDDGRNGFLCQPRSAASLAQALERMLRLSQAERDEMGRSARLKVEREFDQALVVKAYLEAVA